MSPNESTVETATLEWFEELRYAEGYGPDNAPGEKPSERESFGEVMLMGSLRKRGHLT